MFHAYLRIVVWQMCSSTSQSWCLALSANRNGMTNALRRPGIVLLNSTLLMNGVAQSAYMSMVADGTRRCKLYIYTCDFILTNYFKDWKVYSSQAYTRIATLPCRNTQEIFNTCCSPSVVLWESLLKDWRSSGSRVYFETTWMLCRFWETPFYMETGNLFSHSCWHLSYLSPGNIRFCCNSSLGWRRFLQL